MINIPNLTQTEIAKKKIEENRTPSMSEIVEDFINEFLASKERKKMEEGVRYFKNKNDIRDRKMYYFDDNGQKREDETATNKKLSHNWHKLLVKQKMGYLVGKPITFSDSESSEDDDGEESPNEEFIELINNVLADDFDDKMNELVKGSSNKGIEWLHSYIDSEGNFNYTIVDARQVIPIWETRNEENLDSVIRFYELTVNGKERIRAELWDDEKVTYFLEDESGNLIKDNTMESNPQGHLKKVRELDGEIIEEDHQGWGKVPFIPFKNNEEMLPDLNDYKELVDDYDENRSDLSNNLTDIQEIIYVLKNYAGQNLKEFLENLKFNKAIKVEGDGGVDTITIEIPIEAKKEHTDTLTEDIFMFGQGVNIKTDRFGNSPSGVALSFLYAQLDLKCDTTERKFQKSIKNFLWFIAKYFEIKERKQYNHKAVDITFNKSMIINEAEKIESAQKSKGIVDPETIVANHPWADDPQKILEKLEQQRESAAESIFGERYQQELDDMAGEDVDI